MNLFSAQDCWVALCEEESNPTEMLLQIIFEEIARCAGAELDFNPCILDQIFVMVDSSNDSDETLDGIRRRLEQSFGSPGENDDVDPCLDQLSDHELEFAVGLMLAGAQEQCMNLGETFEEGEIVYAQSELFKLFSAQHCWGSTGDCNERGDEHQSGDYLDFIEESAILMLSSCANVQEVPVPCVFSRSIEVMHGVNYLGWSHDGSTSFGHLSEELVSSICIPPSTTVHDIQQIVTHAEEYCIEFGDQGANYHYEQAVTDLQNLVADHDCWAELCEPEMKENIVEEWMHTCASVDLKFLTTHDDDSLDNTPLDDDILHCMIKFIVPEMEQPDANWACILPHVGNDICNLDAGKEAYIFCGGELGLTHWPSPSSSTPPTPSPSMQFSMSFAYSESDSYDWADFDPEMSFSYSYGQPTDIGFSMTYDVDDEAMYLYDQPTDIGFSMPYDADDDAMYDEEQMHMYIGEVCSLISGLNSNIAGLCLQPVCDDLWVEDLIFRDDTDDYDLLDDTLMPTMTWTLPPQSMPSSSPSNAHTSERPSIEGPTTSVPSASPSLVPTAKITSPPSRAPIMIAATPFITKQPTSSPTSSPITKSPTLQPSAIPGFGSVSVSVEVEVKLEGINITDIDFTALDEVVNLLEVVLGDMLPEEAMVRLLSVGGFSVTRRLLRFLADDSTGGVDVQFEITMTESCSSAKCDASEADQISETLYQDVTSDLKSKVESGELTTAIQEKAEATGVSELITVSVSASTMQVSDAVVTVKEANEVIPDDPTDDDEATSASAMLRAMLSLLAVMVSTLLV